MSSNTASAESAQQSPLLTLSASTDPPSQNRWSRRSSGAASAAASAAQSEAEGVGKASSTSDSGRSRRGAFSTYLERSGPQKAGSSSGGAVPPLPQPDSTPVTYPCPNGASVPPVLPLSSPLAPIIIGDSDEDDLAAREAESHYSLSSHAASDTTVVVDDQYLAEQKYVSVAGTPFESPGTHYSPNLDSH